MLAEEFFEIIKTLFLFLILKEEIFSIKKYISTEKKIASLINE